MRPSITLKRYLKPLFTCYSTLYFYYYFTLKVTKKTLFSNQKCNQTCSISLTHQLLFCKPLSLSLSLSLSATHKTTHVLLFKLLFLFPARSCSIYVLASCGDMKIVCSVANFKQVSASSSRFNTPHIYYPCLPLSKLMIARSSVVVRW